MTRRTGRLAAAAFAVALAAAASAAGSRAAPQRSDYALESVWPAAEGDSEPIGVAVAPSGAVWSVQAARGPADRFASLVRRDGTGAAVSSVVVRDASGRELRPLAAAVSDTGALYASTDELLLALRPDGTPIWEAPAGDGHAAFGPAARSLAALGGALYGTDLVNGRVLGYGAADGRLALRLGTVGASPGSYRGPMDVAVGAGGTLYVADFGNRRVQVLDPSGNPLARFALPARPRALAVDADGYVFVVLDDERVTVLDPTGVPLVAFGEPGHGPGQLHMAWDIAVAADGRLYVADRGNRRIQVFRPGGPAPGTASATPSAPAPTPAATPFQVDACPGRPAVLSLDVTLPPVPPRADVLLVFDTTGSMEGVVDVARTRALEIADRLAALAPDAAFGVMDVRDYPYGRAGLATDWPFALRGALSPRPEELERATGLLYATGGGDAPEAYAGAIDFALTDARVGWREGARRVVVLLGDSVPRDDDLNRAVVDPQLPGPWAPGRPSWWRDSGADWVPATPDDLSWVAVLARMRASDTSLIALVSGAAPEAAGGRMDVMLAYWRAWAGMAGPNGDALDIRQVSALPEALATGLAGIGRSLERLTLAAEPAARAAWMTIDPLAHRSVEIGPDGARRSFQVALEAEPGTPSGDHPLALVALGDGAAYARWQGVLRWRASCAPTAAPPEPTPTVAATVTIVPTPTATASPIPPPSPTATATSRAALRTAYLPRVLKRHCAPGERKPADIAIVLDTSSSMAGAKLAAARDAAVGFVELLDLPTDRAAVVTFHAGAEVGQGLTGSRTALLAALDDTRTGEGTRIDLGLAAATDELAGPRARPDATAVIVLLTDGRPAPGTENALRLAAERAGSAGVTVFAIGLGRDVDADLLAAVAGDPTRYYFAPDAAELRDIYRRIAGGLPCGRP